MKGYAERLSSAAAATTRFGEVRTPRVAGVAKVKNNKKRELRLIVDMLRSGTTWRIVVRERLVLSRMTDFAELIVNLLEPQTVGSAMSRCEPRLRYRRRHAHAHHLRAGAPARDRKEP